MPDRRLITPGIHVILLLFVVACAILLPALANAAPANCVQIVQTLNNTASAISNTANDYWGHRGNYVDLIYGPSRDSPNAQQLAEQEKVHADAEKAAMPNGLASFKAAVASAQSQKCLSPIQLSAIVEPTVKFAKRVNFDQFPVEELESRVGQGTPPQMPMH